MAQKAGSKSLPPLLLVLTAVGIHRHHQGDGVGTCLVDGIDGYQHGHDVVVYRKHLGVLAAVQFQRLVVLHILKDVHILSTDTLVDLCLKLPVHKVGELGIHLEAGNPVLVCGTSDAEVCGLDIIDEIDVPSQLVLGQLVPLGDGICLQVEAVLVHVAQMDDNLVGKFLSAGTGDNGKICGLGIGHDNKPL